MIYGLLIALGSISVTLLAEKLIKNKKLGIDEKEFWNVTLIIVLLSLVGGRIYHVFDKLSFYSKNPVSVFYIWNGGMGIYGAFIGVMIFLALYSKFHKRKLYLLTDLICFFVPLVHIAGRIGNYFNKELTGGVVEIPIFLIFCLAEFIFYKRINFGKGNLTGIYLITYGLTRLVEEKFRDPINSFIINNINLTVLLSVFLITVGFGIILRNRMKN